MYACPTRCGQLLRPNTSEVGFVEAVHGVWIKCLSSEYSSLERAEFPFKLRESELVGSAMNRCAKAEQLWICGKLCFGIVTIVERQTELL